MENQAVSGTKKPLFGGRKPLFTQKELLLLTGPLLVEQLLEVTVGMADTMMVSRCGEAAISGVSLVDMINNLIIVLFAALATGGAVVTAQYLGARNRKKACESIFPFREIPGSKSRMQPRQVLRKKRIAV